MNEELTEPVPPIDPSQNDWFLETLVRMVNGTDDRLPITLLVDGFIVCGDLVGGNTYFQVVLDKYLNSGVQEDFLSLAIKEASDRYSDDSIPIGYVHLLSSKFYHPNGRFGMPVNNDQEFRIKIEKISGFHYGRYKLPKDDDNLTQQEVPYQE